MILRLEEMKRDSINLIITLQGEKIVFWKRLMRGIEHMTDFFIFASKIGKKGTKTYNTLKNKLFNFPAQQNVTYLLIKSLFMALIENKYQNSL